MSPCPEDPPVEADPSGDSGCCAPTSWVSARVPLPPAFGGRGPAAGRKENGPTLSPTNDYNIKPMYPSGEHGRGHRLA